MFGELQMKEEIPYRPFQSFMVRSPYFPFTLLESLLSEKEVRELCSRPEIQEAIFLASPELAAEIPKWLNDDMKENKERERMLYSCMRYILRMSTRPTPFGVFAGFSIGRWGEKTEMDLAPRQDYQRHTRLDMNYLCSLALDLAKRPEIKHRIRYYPNSSIYRVGEQIRYVEYRYRNNNRTHHIVAVDDNEYLQRVLNEAEQGAEFDRLAEILIDEEITLEEAQGFIDELIDSQILVHDLEPAITGPEFLDQILEVLHRFPEGESFHQTLSDIRETLRRIDSSPVGTTLQLHKDIADHLKPLGTALEMKYLYQTDMVKPVSTCQLDQNRADDVLNALEVMNRLTPPWENANLKKFKETFMERYEDQEVPLSLVLDSETGIGYKQGAAVAGDVSPLVDDLVLPGGAGSNDRELRWNPIQSFLFNKYRDWLTQGGEVELTDEELKPFPANWTDLPDTISTMIHVLYDPGNGGERFIIESAGGSGAANLLGRFCHAHSETNDLVMEIMAKEAELSPDIIYAEIVHLPQSRIGNILLRPVIRPYEIPYLARSAVSTEFQIRPDDLMVSIKGNRVVLRSRRLNKIVIPRLTTAHNFSNNALPIYQFLCDLQSQNKRGGVSFNWGALSGDYPVLPRVVYKNIILAMARWNIQVNDPLKKIMAVRDDEALLKAVTNWRTELKIPAQVLLADGDNELFIDFESVLSIQTLLSVVKKRGNFQLVESLFSRENALVRSSEGSFTNEFVLSFHRIPEDVKEKSENKND